MVIENDLLSIVRELNRDIRDAVTATNALAVVTAEHTAQLHAREKAMDRFQDDVDVLERRLRELESSLRVSKPEVPWKIVGVIVGGLVMIVLAAMFLTAGGNPESMSGLLRGRL